MLKRFAMELLRTQGWLATVPDNFAVAVLSQCDLITLQRGQTFYSAGDEGGGIYGVAAGRLEIHVPSIGDRPTLTHISGVGAWFGDIGAFGDGERKVSIIVDADTKLMRLSRSCMQRITEQDPAAWQHFSKLLAINFSMAIAIIAALRNDSPLQRVSATLLNLVGADPHKPGFVPVSQIDIGAIVNASRSTVNLALVKLESIGAIRRHYGEIEIINLRTLRQILSFSNVV